MTAPRRIETSRLWLDCWTVADAVDLRAVLDQNDAHLRPWIPFMREEPRTLAATRERLAGFEQQFSTGTNLRYAIRERRGGALIGETMLLDRVGPEAREIGYWLAASRCGHGYATEATRELLPVAFDRLLVARVVLRCDDRNHASQTVATRLGASVIGEEHTHENVTSVRLFVFGLERAAFAARAR